MRKFSAIILTGALLASALSSCKTSYQSQAVQYNGYRITQGTKQDSSLLTLIQPYKDSVNSNMNGIVAVAGMTLEKKQPEGTLGNVLADGMFIMATRYYKMPIDAAFVNYGGIRLPSIAAGNITRGKIFELAPFDNIIVLQKINGKIMQQFLDHIADQWGGWPAAGITWQIKNKKAINVLIGGKPLDENATYLIANNDYVANGGDDCIMLKSIPQINNGLVFRTAILEYFSQLNKEGKTITAKIENRVTNAD
jgi:2',3'-cyclic-nucleotide 2'-phosphodiesterase (5'-nucleotidase family)